MADVHGHCAPGFESFRGALSEALATGVEVGAALAVYVDKEAVVDLWGGHADAAKTRPWTADTIVNLYSIGKAVTAVCALRLVDAGALDLDAPVSRYWPEFAQAGKAQLPVRFLLTHQAGLPAIGPTLAADPDARVAFGYAMNQGRGGWQHKHVRDLIDQVYARL